MATEKLQLVIEANDRSAKSAFSSVSGDIGNMERQALRVAQSIQTAFMNMAREVQRAIQSLQGSFASLDQQAHRAVGQSHISPGSSMSSTPAFNGGAMVAASAAGSIFGSRSAGSFGEARIWDVERELAKSEAYYRLHEKTGQRRYERMAEEAYFRFEAMQESNNALANAIRGNASANEELAASAGKAKAGMAGQMIQAVALYQAMETGLDVVKGLTIESTKYAAQSQSYQFAMHAVAKANGVASQSADDLEKKLKSLGITTQASRQAITMAISAGMPLDKMPQMARLGQNLAVMKPDMTSSQVFNNLLYGIQSGQTDVLRTIGLNVSFENGYKEFARAAKRTTESLSEQEKMQIRVNTVLKEAAKYNGMYEGALGSAGKQLQSMRRYVDEAQEAIGKQFIPAMHLVVSTATWALQTIMNHPMAQKVLGVIGSAGAGAALGGMVGGAIGTFAGGVGAIPGAVIGAKIGAGVGTVVGAGSIAYGEYETSRQQARDQYAWYKEMRKTRDEKITDLLTYTRGIPQREQAPTPEADGKAAKQMAAAEKDARNDLRRAQEQELEGLQRILAEHKNKLDALREEGVLTQKVKNLRFQELQANLNAYYNREDRQVREKYSDLLKDGDVSRKERTRLGGEYTTQEADALARRNDVVIQGYREFYQRRNEIQQQAMNDYRSHLERQRDLELGSLNESTAITVAQKLALEQQKLAIEEAYIQKTRDADLRMLAFKADIAKKEIAIRYAGNDQLIRNLQRLVDLEQQQAEKAVVAAASDKTQQAKLSAIQRQYGVIYDANKRLYDQLKHSAEGIFDAMLNKSTSVWQAMANAFKVAFLTVFKEIVTSQVARSLTGLLTGQRVGLAAGGGNMTGRAGSWATALGGIGIGSVPIIGGGNVMGGMGTYAGTPPFNPAQGMGGAFNLRGLFSGGAKPVGQVTPVPGLIGVGMDQNGNMVNMSTGQLMGQAAGLFGTKGAQAMFGKMGKFGGAAQAAALMGGVMVGADGLQRGGLTGMLETTAGGAMIGAAFGGPVGAAIGAGIGAIAGGIRMLFKSPEDKMRERIKSLTGLDVTQKNILKQAVEMAKEQAGGNFDLWIRSKSGQDFLEMYALNTGQKFRSAFNARSFTFAQSGGSLYETPSFLGGSAMGQISSLPGIGFSASLDNVRGSGMSTGPMSVRLQIDGPATQQLMRGEAVNVIVENPRLVQASAASALTSNSGRNEMASSLLSPGLVRG